MKIKFRINDSIIQILFENKRSQINSLLEFATFCFISLRRPFKRVPTQIPILLVLQLRLVTLVRVLSCFWHSTSIVRRRVR